MPFFDAIILSPGPGRPDVEADFGFNSHLIREAKIPILGICLGHQGIGTSFGADISHARNIKHGQVSQISHDGTGILEGIPQRFDAVGYNSLVLDLSCKFAFLGGFMPLKDGFSTSRRYFTYCLDL